MKITRNLEKEAIQNFVLLLIFKKHGYKLMSPEKKES